MIQVKRRSGVLSVTVLMMVVLAGCGPGTPTVPPSGASAPGSPVEASGPSVSSADQTPSDPAVGLRPGPYSLEPIDLAAEGFAQFGSETVAQGGSIGIRRLGLAGRDIGVVLVERYPGVQGGAEYLADNTKTLASVEDLSLSVTNVDEIQIYVGTPRNGSMGFAAFQLGDRFIYVFTRETDPVPVAKTIIDRNR